MWASKLAQPPTIGLEAGFEVARGNVEVVGGVWEEVEMTLWERGRVVEFWECCCAGPCGILEVFSGGWGALWDVV